MLGVAPINEKMIESLLKWSIHMQQKPITTPVRYHMVQVRGIKRTRGKRKTTLTENSNASL